VIAHRSALVRDVLRLLAAEQEVVVVGEARTAPELADLCRSERPAVAVAEATFGDGSELEAVLHALDASGTRTVVVSDDPSPERVTRILLLGAAGFVRSDTTPGRVVEAITTVAAGASVLGPDAATTILEQWRRMRETGGRVAGPSAASLTSRERDVLHAMADGLGTKAIATRLGVAAKTVENHKIRIFDKIGARSQAQAVSLAISHGWLAGAAGSMIPAPSDRS
jgi:DNA-binding NarL/FixJ family response regulator